MKKIRSLILPLLVAVVGVSPAWAESKEEGGAPAEALAAAALAEEGWAIVGTPGTPQPFFADQNCDAPELALDRFRRAAELDPDNASAWHGWGRAEQDLGPCPTGHGGLMTWMQMEGLAYIDFQNIFSLPFDRTAGVHAAAASATDKLRRAAALAPDSAAVLADLARNLTIRLWGEKDPAARRLLADEAMAAFEKSRELNPVPPDPWSSWDMELLYVIAAEEDPAVWGNLLAGLLRLYDRQADVPAAGAPLEAASGRAAKAGPDERARAWERVANTLLEAAQASPERLGREKALALLSAAHIRAVRLTALKDEGPATGAATGAEGAAPETGHLVAVGEAQPAPDDSSVVVVKKSRQVDPKEVWRLRRWGLLGKVELSQAAFEAGLPQWREQVETAAREYWVMINGLKALYFPEGHGVQRLADQTGHFQAINEWVEAAGREPRDDRRLILALGALDILEDALKLRESLPEPERPADFFQDNPGRDFQAMLKIAGVMPEGDKRDTLTAKAEAGFSQLAKSDRPTPGGYYGSIYYQWAEALIELSRRETDLRKFKELADRAGGLVRQALEEAEAPAPPRDPSRNLTRQAMAYQQWLTQEKNPERRRYFLESALGRLDEALRTQSVLMTSGVLSSIYNGVMGDMCFQLSELTAPDAGRRMWFTKAALHYQRADQAGRADRMPGWTGMDYLFRLGQVYAHHYLTGQTVDDKYLLAALDAWRDYFACLPERAERLYYPRHPADGGDQAPETFRASVTRDIATRMMAIHTVLDFERLSPRAAVAMAGLYRELAVSAVLTPEYQGLYLGRAEKMLRRAVERGVETAARADEARENESGVLAIPNADYQLGTANRQPYNAPARDVFRRAAERDLARAKAELALVLSERTLLGGPCGEGGRECLAEAEKLWLEAEVLAPGSSRYARARWAAWLGDLETVKAMIGHTRDDNGLGFFPPLAEALRDPAFDEVKAQPWFKKQWYGFVR